MRLLPLASLVCSLSLAPFAPAGAQQQPAKQNLPFDLEADIEYGKAGERSLKLDVLRPKNPSAKSLPIVVWIHGGGWQGGDKASGRGLLAGFVSSGNYVGFSIGYRLSGEAVWPAQAHDCKAGLRWIRANAAKHGGDPDRIGLWGSSAGGHLVSLLGTSSDVKQLDGENGTPGVSMKVTCVVDYCGPADFGNFRHPAADRLFGGSVANAGEQGRLASPIAHVTADDPPFLVVHGTADGTVPYTQGASFHEALKKAGVNSTLVTMEGGSHSIGGPEIQSRVRNFFELHLRGQKVEVSAAPIKVEPPKTDPSKADPAKKTEQKSPEKKTS